MHLTIKAAFRRQRAGRQEENFHLRAQIENPMNETSLEQAADRIWKVYQDHNPCNPVRDLIGEADLQQAYAVQQLNTQKWLAMGRRVVGRKIGLTSEAVQKQLGVDQPDYGMLFDHMQVAEGGQIPWNEVHQPKVEMEVAFVLNQALDQANITEAQLVAAIDHAVAAMEIVGSRIEGWNIRITDTVADNASSSHFVLGKERKTLDQVDLVNCRMKMTKRGEVVSEGMGKACLGSPVYAALWLAQTMSDLGRPLQAGDIILAGALGPMCAVQPGDSFEGTIDGFGGVSVSFGE